MQYIGLTYADAFAEDLVKNLSSFSGKYWNIPRTKQALTFDLVNQSTNGNKRDLVFKAVATQETFQ